MSRRPLPRRRLDPSKPPTERRRAGTFQAIIRNYDPSTGGQKSDDAWIKCVKAIERHFRSVTGKCVEWHSITEHTYGHDEHDDGHVQEDAGANGWSEALREVLSEQRDRDGSNQCAEGAHLHVIYRHYKGNGHQLGR